MASPFDVFRKNQKVLMALLVGFAMFAFIAADSIDATTFPIFLGAIFGALGLWLLSGKGGAQGWAIAAVGGVVGALVGVYGPNLFGGNAVVQTAEGDLSRRNIDRLLQRQDQANQFLALADRTVREKLPEAERARYAGPSYFGFGGGPTAEAQTQNALMNFLFQQEAEDLGVRIDDPAVNRYLNDVFQSKLTTADVERIRAEMRIGVGELYDVLREQLQARIAFQTLAPESVKALQANNIFEVMQELPRPTPQELWAEYKKLEAKAEVTAVPISAEKFLAQVPEPSEAELAAFFEAGKSVLAAGPGSPGFMVPRQFQVAYVALDMEQVRKSVTPPTDEEVMAFYDKNRSRFDLNTPPAGETAPQEQTPIEAPRPAAAAEAAGETAPNTREEGAEASDPPANEPETNESPAEEPETPETPAAEESAAASDSADAADPGDDPATPAEPEAAPETPPGDNISRVSRDGFEFVAFQQEEQPAPDRGASEEAPTDAAAATQPAAEAPAETPSPTPPTFPAPADEQKPGTPSPETLNAIREDLINQQARTAADERLKAIRDDVDRIVSETFDAVLPPEDPQDGEAQNRYEAERKAAVKKVVDQVKEYARKNGLRFQTTPFLSGEGLYESDDYPIGKAVLWEANRPFTPQDATPVAFAVAQSSPDQPLTTIAAQSPFDETRYIALKIADTAPRVPTLEEKDVKARVVEAWKRKEAQELAKARAEELAKADTPETDLAKVADGKTVTGKQSGEPLAVRQVGPFAWLRRSTVPGAGFSMPDLVPTTLPELPAAGEGFMKKVFEELNVGESGVVPGEDGSTFYVVELDSKPGDADLEKVREGFMKEEFFFIFSPYRTRLSAEAQRHAEEWFRTFRAKHGVIDPTVPEIAPAA